MLKRFSSIIAVFVVSVLARPCSAALIDFESIPGVGAPTAGLAISNQFLATAGVSFSLEGGGNPVIARVGNPRTAFQGFGGAGDTPAPGQEIGTYFLTDDGVLGGNVVQPLIASYASPTMTASGVILDIDFTESFLIEARDMSGTVLESILIEAGDPDTGDGIATNWSFSRPSADVWSIRFAGSRPSGQFGLGFDNFESGTPGLIPEPSSLLLLSSGIGLGLLALRGRRKA
jgi:hypothetical protein